ncbi:MAG: hypothetical protein ACR2H2_13350 [Solirubrobacteraceae bacterium]
MAIIKGQDVIESYQDVIPGAGQLAEQYVQGIAQSVREQELPVEIGVQQASTGLLRSVMGKGREFLVVKPTNRALDVFRILHYGVPNGINLAAGWYLTGRVKGFGTMQFRVPVLHDIDIFDNADLQALVTGIHQFAVIDSLLAIADKVGYDRDRVNRKSTGLFGVG